MPDLVAASVAVVVVVVVGCSAVSCVVLVAWGVCVCFCFFFVFFVFFNLHWPLTALFLSNDAISFLTDRPSATRRTAPKERRMRRERRPRRWPTRSTTPKWTCTRRPRSPGSTTCSVEKKTGSEGTYIPTDETGARVDWYGCLNYKVL